MQPPSPLRKKRLEAGLTLTACAIAAGVSPELISQVERGKKRLGPETRRRVDNVIQDAIRAAERRFVENS